jgi:arabinogalactan oligomer/maltooligosaccharide transport system substrate-binding protein
MKKKVLALVLAVAMSAAALTGCGNNVVEVNNEASETMEEEVAEEVVVEDVALKVWCAQNQIDGGSMDEMCAIFQEMHPEWNITFTVEAVGEDVAKEEVLKDVAVAGDVFFFANDQLTELVNAGAIAKLGGSTADMVNNEMAEAVAKTVKVGDDIYGIPFTHNTFFMYYDKSLLSEEDVQSVEGIMAVETADDVYNFVFDSAGGWKLGSWYYGAGCTVYGEDQVSFEEGCNWNNETGLAVTNYLIDLIGNPKCAYADDVSVSELVADHRVGAWFDGAWNYETYKEALGDDLGLAIIPTFNPDGTDYQLKGFYGSKAIGVNAQAANPAAAVAFAAFLGSEDMQIKRFEDSAQVPTNITAGESEAVQADEVASVIVAEANEASVMQPTASEFGTRYWANAGAIATEIRSGDLNKDNAQEKLDAFVAAMVVE